MLNAKLQEYIKGLNPSGISDERKVILQKLIDFIQVKLDAQEAIELNFICTHNSRRSHFAQVWAQSLAHHFKVPNIQCYSSGTETTALFPAVVETLKNAGFIIEKTSNEKNPIYHIHFSENENPIISFSKTIEDEFNPKSDFAAIMTCNHADQNCPIVKGASHRIALPFDDPKTFDNTPLQIQKYEERSFQIASELYYVYSEIKI